jgi:hypothetical protein
VRADISAIQKLPEFRVYYEGILQEAPQAIVIEWDSVFGQKKIQADVPKPCKFASHVSRSVENTLQPQLRAPGTTGTRKKRGGIEAPADSYRSVLQSQQFQACEIAFAALGNRNEQVLRWFTRDVLHVAVELTPMVCMALWEKNKAGEYYWSKAQYPLAYLRTLAVRAAVKWKRDPIMGGAVRGKAANAGAGISRSQYTKSFDSSRLDEGYEFDGMDWHDAVIEYHAFKAWDGSPDHDEFFYQLNTIDQKFLSKQGNPHGDWPSSNRGPDYDWESIGKELGFDEDEISLLKGKAKGITRERMAGHLLWTEKKVEAVWRRVNRKMDKPALAEKAKQKLVSRRPFTPPSLAAESGESNS